MCSNTLNSKSSHDPFSAILCGKYLSMRPKVHVHKITRSSKSLREAKEEKGRAGKLREMEVKNMELYLMNKIIIEENEKLRRRAMMLLQEKKTLQSQFQSLCNPQ